MTNPTTVTVVPDTPYIEIVRDFDAPVSDVFRAHVEPDLVVQWLGPHGYDMDVRAWDARTGGSYRYVHTNPDGDTFGFRGSFHSVDADARIVQTFEYDGAPGEVSLETAVFEDLGNGRTRVTGHSVYGSVAARDAMAASGMETGVIEGYERLDATLARS